MAERHIVASHPYYLHLLSLLTSGDVDCLNEILEWTVLPSTKQVLGNAKWLFLVRISQQSLFFIRKGSVRIRKGFLR